jgi:hypothetical protein
MANKTALQHKAPDWTPMWGVVTAGSPPYLHAIFPTWAECARWILAHGMRATAWIIEV